ncbi:uncharacterized protein LOC126645257 [Myiozetetes cayanensis]|uniref:uncharacterized protein LOC126645257 n=1 Tax=Myiozetetes cayanensis TaxID=478635 RepID=UPI00215F8E51|nr:uncharacterized protein LOC126645257 [Myiozetetes cayanensis]
MLIRECPLLSPLPLPDPAELTDALERGVCPRGPGGAVPQDALDEVGSAGFPLVARVAGVAQERVQPRAVPSLDVRVGHGLGAAASRWRGMENAWNRSRDTGKPPGTSLGAAEPGRERPGRAERPCPCLELGGLCGPSQPKPRRDSMKSWLGGGYRDWMLPPGLGEPHPASGNNPGWLCLDAGIRKGKLSLASLWSPGAAPPGNGKGKTVSSISAVTWSSSSREWERENSAFGIFVVTWSSSSIHQRLCGIPSPFQTIPGQRPRLHPAPSCCISPPLLPAFVFQLDMKNSRHYTSPPACSQGFSPTLEASAGIQHPGIGGYGFA